MLCGEFKYRPRLPIERRCPAALFLFQSEDYALTAMRGLLVLLIACFASPAVAQIKAEARNVSPSGVTVILTATQDIQVSLISATLIDGQGHSYSPSSLTRGITVGIQSSCKINSSLTAGARQIISTPFKAQNSTAPYALTLEFETPDSSQMFGCRAFSVSLDDLRP